MSKTEEALVHHLSPVCAEQGARLYDVEVVGTTLRVTVLAGGELDLEALAAVARVVSAFLDDHEELAPAGPYELEVGSPGLERRLRTPTHLAGAVGERVSLRLRPGIVGERRLEGLLEEADEVGIVVVPEGGSPVHVAYGDLERAHTVFDWRRAFSEDKHERRSERGADTATTRKVARS